MPVDQWGNVIFADELTKSGLQQNQDERERKRQGEFANYLQDQGMAPGKGMTQSMGTEFNQFLKSGGLKGYQEEQIAQQQGESLAGVGDGIAKEYENEHALYEKSVGYLNTIHDSGVRTPEMVRVNVGSFPLSLRDIKPGRVQTVNPNQRFDTGMLVPQTNDKGTSGQTITKFDGGDATGAEDYKGSYQVFTPPPAVPQPGQIGPRILAKLPIPEEEKFAHTEFAVNSMRNIADKIRSLNLTDAQRVELYSKMTLGKWLPGTRAVGALTLPP